MRGARRKVIDAGLTLLDRQIVDRDGKMAGKVDDLELIEADGSLYVSAILSGPGALAGQLGGRIGKWLASVHARLHPAEQPEPANVPFELVKKIAEHVDVTVSRDDLDISRFEDWARDTIIGKIPGAFHEAE